MSAVAAVRLEEATRRYGSRGADGAFVLQPTSLALLPGQWTAIGGRSGAGKTTLLNLAGLLDRPDRGRVWVFGRPLDDHSDAALSEVRRLRLGFVYQQFVFLERLPVWENVTCRLVPAGVPARERRQRALALLEELGVGHAVDRLPRALSGGEQQRVALARALCASPRILIADEPTSNVDAQTAEVVAGCLARLRATGSAILTASHDPLLVAAADVRYTLEAGTLAGC